MKQIKPIGLLLGLAGNLIIGVAIFKLISGGECGDFGQPVCSDETAFYGLALPVGMILSIAACFLGGALLSFCGSFLAVGIGAMASAAINPIPGMESFGWWFGGMFTFFGLLPLLLIPYAARAVQKEKRQLDLLHSGRSGIGTIVKVRDTGITINEDPRIELVVRVEPTDGGPPVELTKRVTAPRLSVPRRGERYPVWFDPNDPANWFMVTEVEPHAPDAVRRLFEQVRREREQGGSPVEELERLDRLRRSGALSEAEFIAAKERLLATA